MTECQPTADQRVTMTGDHDLGDREVRARALDRAVRTSTGLPSGGWQAGMPGADRDMSLTWRADEAHSMNWSVACLEKASVARTLRIAARYADYIVTGDLLGGSEVDGWAQSLAGDQAPGPGH